MFVCVSVSLSSLLSDCAQNPLFCVFVCIDLCSMLLFCFVLLLMLFCCCCCFVRVVVNFVLSEFCCSCCYVVVVLFELLFCRFFVVVVALFEFSCFLLFCPCCRCFVLVVVSLFELLLSLLFPRSLRAEQTQPAPSRFIFMFIV